MKNFDIPAYINLILIAVNIGISTYTFNSGQKNNRIDPIINNLLHKVFIPFQNSIGKSLFKKIDSNNVNGIHKSLVQLQKEIKDNELEFGLSYSTSYYLDRIITLGLPKDKKQFKRYNYEYKNFSSQYFKDQNKFRKKTGLPSYNRMYRVSFKLYRNSLSESLYHVWLFTISSILTVIAMILINMLSKG